ncbi:MAG: heavy metal translocating P-type ATPase [Phycisphaerales bacterium]
MSRAPATSFARVERQSDRAATPISTKSTVACAHCGLPVPGAFRADLNTPSFCCAGCQTAHEIIHTCGLERYYELLQNAANPVLTKGRSFAEFDDPEFLKASVATTPEGLSSIELVLSGVHCAACVWLVERLPRLAPGVLSARLDMRRSRVRLAWNPGAIALSTIARTLDSIGYTPAPIRDAASQTRHLRDDRAQLIRLGVAGACAGNVMLYAICLYAGVLEGIEAGHALLFSILSLIVTTISVAWPGRVFFRSAIAAIRARTPHIDVPIAIALAVGWTWSLYSTVTRSGDVYYDSLAMLVFALLVGRYIQSRQQRRAHDAVAALFALTPTWARVVEDGTTREVATESLAVGMLIEIHSGEAVPADATITAGASHFDRSLLTGESTPIEAMPGGTILAGTTNLSSTIRATVIASGPATRLGAITRLMENAATRRAPIVQLADRISAIFVIATIVLAIIAAGVWAHAGASKAISQAVAMLVVTCPCALGLATPLSLSMAMGKAARSGVLIKGGDALQRLANPKTIILDKTGTLTQGRMSIVAHVGDIRALALAAALERHSNHPIARALAAYEHSSPHEPTEVHAEPGRGIEGQVDGSRVLVGRPDYVAERSESAASFADSLASWTNSGHTPILIAIDGNVSAAVALGDSVRDEALATSRLLRRTGASLIIASGDHPAVVARVASTLDIADAHGHMEPEDKVRLVETHREHGTVVMVGDGMNDAAALAAADVGIAVRTCSDASGVHGVEASLAAADVSLATPGIAQIADVLTAARRTMRVIKRNLVVSLGYNVIAASAVILGVVTPLFAAILMPVSSLSVLALATMSRTFDAPPPARSGQRATRRVGP